MLKKIIELKSYKNKLQAGNAEFIILPKVPPIAKAFIPKNMKTNKRPKTIERYIRNIIKIIGVIPSYSSAKKIFLSIK